MFEKSHLENKRWKKTEASKPALVISPVKIHNFISPLNPFRNVICKKQLFEFYSHFWRDCHFWKNHLKFGNLFWDDNYPLSNFPRQEIVDKTSPSRRPVAGYTGVTKIVTEYFEFLIDQLNKFIQTMLEKIC